MQTATNINTYKQFLEAKAQVGKADGFEPLWIPDFLFDFQKRLLNWAIMRGRGAIFADCGLGKTPLQLAWSENIVRKTNKRILIAAPLAVGGQTVREGLKFGVEVYHSRDGTFPESSKIIITNYEQLHKFNSTDFVGMACDESSILKHFSGATQKQVTRFMAKLKYRSLWTATAAPNDYTELGTSAEALGELGYSDMLSRFFKMDDKKRCRMNDVKLARSANTGNHYARLAYRVSQQIGQWRLKGHAEEGFWRWVCSWAIACRKPSDLGFDDAQFTLPPLKEINHVIEPKRAADGMLFTLPAFGLKEEREERKRTLQERCECVAVLAAHKNPVVVWCHLNSEGDLLERLIPGSVQVAGADSDEAKEEAYGGFQSDDIRVLITKPKIGAWGLNWQHCANVITFASHSYEQYYQSVRRCWRFGQTQPVTVDIISSKGEQYVADNMARKAIAAVQMFEQLIAQMNNANSISRKEYTLKPQLPSWLQN